MMRKPKKNRGRDKFSKYKKQIVFLCSFFSLFPEKIRLYIFEVFRMKKGISGLAIRYVLLKTLTEKCGDNVSIHPGVYIFNPERLIIGNNVSIHPMSYIDAAGSIKIGNNVSIAHGVTVMSSTHTYQKINIPIKEQDIFLNKTIINNDVWIGSKATILSGVFIDTGSIIGASSVVTKDIPHHVVAAGVPAKYIKKRGL